MRKKLLLAVLLVLLAGCNKAGSVGEAGNEAAANIEHAMENQETTGQNAAVGKEEIPPKGYVFSYRGVTIGINMEAAPVLDALGEPKSVFEAPSCAYEGMDRVYQYGDFELDTYEKDGKEYISGVFFCTDLIETLEGVSLFETKTAMVMAYGEAAEEAGMYIYEKDGMELKFILEGDEIISIEYSVK